MNLSAIRAIVRQQLNDEFDPDITGEWEDDALDIYILDCLYDVSQAGPYRSKEVLLTVDGYNTLDISGITDLIEINYLEYPVYQTPRKYRNFEWIDHDTIEMKYDSTPDAGESGTLTGTVTFTSGSTTVTGSGTDFDGELAEGYHIRLSTGTRWYRIASVTDDTTLTLCENVHSDDAGADTEDETPYYNDEVCYAYCDKLHMLSETNSTLRPKEEKAVIYGACAKAAIAKSRELINAVNVGGGKTPSDMYNWGLGQLTLFNNQLKGYPPKTKKRYPTS